MNELNEKLANVKKSARTGRKVSTALLIICIVAFVLTVVAGSVILGMGKRFDDALDKAEEKGESVSAVMDAEFLSVSVEDFSKIDTDVPFLQKALDEHPMSTAFGIYILCVSVEVLLLCIVFTVVRDTFALIENEDNPFTTKVIKKVTVVMIVGTICIGLMVGGAAVIYGAILTWLVRTILEYGKVLQTQADETL